MGKKANKKRQNDVCENMTLPAANSESETVKAPKIKKGLRKLLKFKGAKNNVKR